MSHDKALQQIQQSTQVIAETAEQAMEGVHHPNVQYGNALRPANALTFSMILHIPLFYNPDRNGLRRPVEPAKLRETIEEVRQHFSAYSHSRVGGWNRDEQTAAEFTDKHLRFEIDAVFDHHKLAFIKSWKTTLENRFEQHEI